MSNTSSLATLRHQAAVQKAWDAAQWAGITAYARPDASYVIIKEEHRNGEWVYTATHHTDDDYSPSATFTRRHPAKGQGLKQLAARALKG